ncbi:hypothetical protein [Zoogloea sp.]|uniref:hypothetical protein n=1 Tax=Zoogloea sp. TaxID=49181 RepID=UPI0035ADAFB3
MDDQELLELAAKANNSPNIKLKNFGAWIDEERERYWNPLADDGDALRLAVRLRIDTRLNRGTCEAIWIDEDLSETHSVKVACDEAFEGWSAKYAAFRRVVVLAAAEIGKALPQAPDSKPSSLGD